MRHQATGVSIAGVMVLATVFAATSADAQPRWSDKTRLTFDGPVVVPGVTLAAGTYTFKLADSLANRQIVQIWNEDETKLFNTTLPIPTRRTDTSGDVVVKFQRTEAGMAPAIKAWFYPGQRIGHMFVYSGEQARALAKGNKTLALSSDDDPSVEDIAAERQSERRTYQVDEHGTRTEYTPPEGVKRVDDRLVVRSDAESTPAATSGASDARPNPSASDARTATGSNTVTGATPPNAGLPTQIQAQYFRDATIKNRRIDVSSHNGVVTLSGAVESNEEREKAVRLARETEGVRRVEDQLRVGAAALEPPAPVTGTAAQAASEPAAAGRVVKQALAQERRSDPGITARVQSKFFLDDRVKARSIAVSTSNGTVTLGGTVSSEAERQQALSIARSVDGVRDVTDKPAGRGRRAAGPAGHD